MRMLTTLFLNTCHRHLCQILFLTRAGRWTYVFRIRRSVKFFPRRVSSQTSRGVPTVRHWTERYLHLSHMPSHLDVCEQG
jgi:hypothetical protein